MRPGADGHDDIEEGVREAIRIREIGIEKTIIQGEIVYSADIPRIARFDDGVVWTVENLPGE